MAINSGQGNNQKRIIFFFILGGAVIGLIFGWITSIIPAAKIDDSLPTPTQKVDPLITIIPGTPTPTEQFVPAQEMMVGGTAPDFSLKTLEGKEIRLSALRGKPVMINLWATWCPPCKDEMSLLEAAFQKHQDKGLMILAIDIPAEDSLTDIKAFAKDKKLTFPILLDEGGQISRGLYSMPGRPTTYFIDRKGILRRIQVGEILPEKMDGYLADILP